MEDMDSKADEHKTELLTLLKYSILLFYRNGVNKGNGFRKYSFPLCVGAFYPVNHGKGLTAAEWQGCLMDRTLF